MNNAVHFSSATDNWKTPSDVYKTLDAEFHFDFDPCPLNPKFDGLNIEWGSCNFVNPPYSQLKKWLKKGWEEHKKGKTVVFLIPSRTDTIAWHEYVMKATEIRFIKGRLKFGDSKNSAPFPSAIVVFKKYHLWFYHATSEP
jgi:phage N-6-adenine-methyltransferase